MLGAVLSVALIALAPPTAAAVAVPGQVIAGPAQPGTVVYGDSASADAYAHAGALVVAGRSNYADATFRRVSAKGGTVLIYLDPVIDNVEGRYHELLLTASGCGPAVPRWPGAPRANEFGSLTDFREGGVLTRKLACVLETMVAENPHMAGWMVDDLGSRSNFPLVDWRSWSSADRAEYRRGAIALSRVFRTVADRHGLIFLVNGSWNAGDPDVHGGGYPDPDRHGNALADGGVLENQDSSDPAFVRNYSCSRQWAQDSPVTRGLSFSFAIATSNAARLRYIRSTCAAFVGVQSDYQDAAPVWGPFRQTGLPSRVRSTERDRGDSSYPS